MARTSTGDRPGGDNRPGRARAGAQPSSRARAARARLEQQQRRRRQFVIAGVASAAVIAVIVILVAVGLSGSGSSGPTKAASGYSPPPAPASVVSALEGIPVSQLAAAAKSGVATAPKLISGGAALTSGGLPEVLYIGAEYCPYCAAERWALVTALSKFGTFSGLGQTTSSAVDVHPSTPTFSFYQSTYASKYLNFQAVEETTNKPSGNGYETLETPTAAQEQVFRTDNPGGSIPFVDYGGRWTTVGASYDIGALDGKTMEQIAQAAADPNSRIGQQIQAAAGAITKDLCRLTNGQPADVCTALA